MQTAQALTMRRGISRAFFLLLFAVMPLPAHADAVSLGVTAAVTTGTTNRSQSSSAVPVIPVPLLSLRVPLNRLEVFAEGVPPIGPVPYGTQPPPFVFFPRNATFSQSTKLSYGYAALRYRVNNVLSVGMGQTLYNQQTTQTLITVSHGMLLWGERVVPVTFANERSQIDASRVPGMRYEAQAGLPLGQMRVTASLALTPSMHAVIHECLCLRSTQTSAIYSRSYTYSQDAKKPETASEVDASVRFTHRSGKFSLTWGLRYLNYIARYDATRALADRNTLVLPFIGVERALGQGSATHQK